MGEYINNRAKRQKVLQKLIRQDIGRIRELEGERCLLDEES